MSQNPSMHIFEPDNGADPRAAIVMFHGGGLRTGSPDDLTPHCRELAARGILAASAGYRLLGQGATTIDDCVFDVRQAVSDFQQLAASRGIEPSRVVSGGSSAGAHLALVAAMAPPTPAPNVAAVVALNPAGLDLRSFDPDFQRRLEAEVCIPPGKLLDYSLIEHVRPGNPPVLIQHGTLDAVEPIAFVRRFRDAMASAGNECTLIEYEDAVHGFHYSTDTGHFDKVNTATARFLAEL